MRAFIIFIVLLLPLVGACGNDAPRNQSLETQTLVIQTQSGKEHSFNVEIADTPETQQIGLMNRNAMPDNHGMLFVFPTSAHRSFWMKNTLIPLDMIFIADNNTIFHIHKNARPHDESSHHSLGQAKMVLEINGGLSDRLGISEGDQIIR